MDNRFLSHLEGCIPKAANNYMLSTYSIILEAWRRGLEIKIRIVLEKSGKIEPYYSISDGNKTHHFSATRGDGVSTKTKDMVKNKQTTKEYLLKNDVPTPEGKDFDEKVPNESILAYAKELQYPLVIKPYNGTGGRGVIAGINNEEELIDALQYVRQELKYPHIIVERYYKGEDYRLYVLDGEIIGALKRIRAHVVGDGKSTIKQLIDKKNKERTKLPSLSGRPIIVDKETTSLLKQQNHNMDSVAKEGEIVYLKTKNNVSAGGDSVEITNQVSENIRTIAKNAVNSFPSLPQGGVDMIVDEENDTGVVIEINSRAHITQHLFPMEGPAQDIPAHIIDYYFPETKNQDKEEANKLYIDYDFIYHSCMSRQASEIELPVLPKSPIILKRYIVTNCNYTEEYAKRIRRFAFNHFINGYIKLLDNGNIAIIVAGNEQKVKLFKERLTKYTLKNNPNAKILEKNRTTPVMHGFHIEDTKSTESPSETEPIESVQVYLEKYSKLQADYQRVVRRLSEYEYKERLMEVTNKQNKQLKKRLKQMESSTSWKITKPLRKIMKLKK